MDEAAATPLGPRFPEIEDYGLLAAGESCPQLQDMEGLEPEGRCTERHLQCIWYDDGLRPKLSTDAGEPLEVESCGRWNLESGPDFIDAVIVVGRGEAKRRVTGDVEIHIKPSGWTAHGHSADPRYSGVVLHLTYFEGARPADLPHGVLCASMRKPLLSRKGFSFDSIDISRFPYADISPSPRPCGKLAARGTDMALAALRAAGGYRIDIKRRRIQNMLRQGVSGRDALYSTVMAALGYKRNAAAFRCLAAAYPLDSWTGDRMIDYARLLGLAGLLPENPPRSESIAPLVRRIWDVWWRNALDMPEEPIAWIVDGMRPQNVPFRRLAAAAALFSAPDALLNAVKKADYTDPQTPRRLARLVVEMASFPEIEPLLSWNGEAGAPIALVGKACASAITTNALVPFLAAFHPLKAREIYAALPPETPSAPMRLMASRIFGRDHNPRLYENSGLLQQGLLQIYNDFCLSCKSDCANCAFARKQ